MLKKEKKDKYISIRTTETIKKEIDSIAKLEEVTNSALSEYLLKLGLEVYKEQNK